MSAIRQAAPSAGAMVDRRIILGLTAASIVGAVAMVVANGGMWEGWGIPGVILFWGVGFCGIGFVIDRAKPGHPVGRKLLWMGPLAGANELVIGSQQFDVEWVGYLTPLMTLFVVLLSLLLHALAIFPDGEWAFPWARWAVVGLWSTAAMAVVISLLAGPVGSMDVVSPYPAVLPAATSDAALVVWNLSTVAIAAGVLWGFYTAEGPYRRQFGWLAFAITISAIAAAAASIFSDIEALAVAASATVLAIPLAIGVAVTRYRLYDIDRVVSRTVSYSIVIVALALVYSMLVLGMRSLLPEVGGPLPVALSTLAVASAFFPFVRRVQAWIDRRFFRSRYIAAEVVASFAADLRRSVDPDEVVDRAEAVVSETFQAESVTLWVSERSP